jgi:hypothetical protein
MILRRFGFTRYHALSSLLYTSAAEPKVNLAIPKSSIVEWLFGRCLVTVFLIATCRATAIKEHV